MNRLEYNKVLETLGINNPIKNTIGKYGTTELVHFWNNVEIHFRDSYYTVISGKVPLEVANIIYEKYPDNPYGIRIDGGCSDYIPIKHAKTERYGNEYYIKLYHIDSKEGLVILLTELSDYYARKQGLPETEVKRYDEIISTITAEILKEINPGVTTYDWMREDEQYGDNFFDTIDREKRTPFGRAFREVIDQFDRTVNPYINDDIELDYIWNYLKKVDISANTYNRPFCEYRENSCVMIIEAKDRKGKVTFFRHTNGFCYELEYVLGTKEHLIVLHYFSDEGSKETDKGECIYINYFGENSKQEIDLRYNITQGLAGETYGDKIPITLEQFTFIYNELVKAIELASTITINNMRKPGLLKKLVPDKVGNGKL